MSGWTKFVGSGEMPIVWGSLGAMAFVFIWLWGLRIEVDQDGFAFKSFFGRARRFQFDQIVRVILDCSFAGRQSHTGVRVLTDRGLSDLLNIKPFGVDDVAKLFKEIQSHGLTIEVPDQRAARSVYKQIMSRIVQEA